MPLKLTIADQARLLFKSRTEPRRNQKRFLRDLGGEGSAEELDAMLAIAENNPKAVAEADAIEKSRDIAAKSIERGVDERTAEILAHIKMRIDASGLSQSEVASRCGWPDSLLSGYLTGQKLPGLANLAKIADALGYQWKMVPNSNSEKTA